MTASAGLLVHVPSPCRVSAWDVCDVLDERHRTRLGVRFDAEAHEVFVESAAARVVTVELLAAHEVDPAEADGVDQTRLVAAPPGAPTHDAAEARADPRR